MTDESPTAHLDALHDTFARLNLSGMWQRGGASAPDVHASIWRWADIHETLEEARRMVRLPEDTDQRVVGLINPTPGAVNRTISFAFQMLNHGESVDSHRHTATQMRFMVDGHGAHTISDGEALPMHPGDLLVQPNWSWHGTTNLSGEPSVWLDAQDRNLVAYLGSFLRDLWAEGGVQPVTQPTGYYGRRFGVVRPSAAVNTDRFYPDPQPPARYPWADTMDALHALVDAGEHNPFEGVILEYTNPLTGGHTVPTMSACVQLLKPGEETRSHRHTGTSMYHVVEGRGTSSIRGEDIDWDVRDCFTVPPLQWHQHRNTSRAPAILFSVSDRPALEALHLYREEVR